MSRWNTSGLLGVRMLAVALDSVFIDAVHDVGRHALAHGCPAHQVALASKAGTSRSMTPTFITD